MDHRHNTEALFNELTSLLLKELERWYSPEHVRFKRINKMIDAIFRGGVSDQTTETIMDCFSLNTPSEELQRARELATILTSELRRKN
jgi:hypothetical protein